MPREPQPRMVQMQHVLAPQAERRELPRRVAGGRHLILDHLGLTLALALTLTLILRSAPAVRLDWLVAARHAHYLETHRAPR